MKCGIGMYLNISEVWVIGLLLSDTQKFLGISKYLIYQIIGYMVPCDTPKGKENGRKEWQMGWVIKKYIYSLGWRQKWDSGTPSINYKHAHCFDQG